jgi:hypothetical protein
MRPFLWRVGAVKQAGLRDSPLSGLFYFGGQRFVADGKNYTVKPGDTLSTICAQNPDLGYSNWKELRDANIAEIMRVGRERMADIGVGEDVTREPCGLPGHSNNQSHLIVGGVHYDEPSVPTIYPGATLFLKNKPQPPKDDEPPQAVAKKEKLSDGEIHKDKWTGVEYQSPAPKLEIFTQGDPATPDITYSADPLAGPYSKLLGYTFSESVDDLEGGFSFTVENEEVEKGKTVFDIIPIRSIVKIYEGDLKLAAFVGIIRRRHIGMSMTQQGPKRTITFSGKSIISCVAEYTVSLDQRIPKVTDAMAKTIDLKNKLGGIRDIFESLRIIWDYFQKISKQVAEGANGLSNTEIATIIEKFIGTFNDFVGVSGKERNIAYDIATVFFNQANNTVVDIWRNILPKPVYEIFSYCDKADGKPKIMVRQVPYGDPDNGNDDWGKLDIYLISPISLMAYDLDQSDEEVYTFFASYIVGSARDRDFYLAAGQSDKIDDTIVRDPEKVAIYGFRPLEISFMGYDRQGNTRNSNNSELPEALRKVNALSAYWYSRLDDMYSGSVTICTDFNNPETNPRVGCRAKFLGGEFYINKTDHTWNYGGTPTIKLTLSRGMMYDENGKMRFDKNDKTVGVIKNVGRRFRELERQGA